jgi:diguanylate cyclase (GGDEF)-like protein
MIGQYKIAALCIAKIQEDSSRKLIAALNQEMDKIGYRLFIYSIDSDLYWNTANEAGEKTVFELIDFSVVDALIIYGERVKNKKLVNNLVSDARRADCPVFMVEGHFERCVNLNFDYTGGFERVVRHVVEEHGAQRVHFMAGFKDNAFSEERQEVVRRVLAEHGLPFGPENVSYGDFWCDPTRRAMEELLSSGQEIPQAIVCANDTMALTVCTVLSEHGYEVPRDVLVTGFDGINEILFSKPQITSCLCSYEEVALKISEFLQDQRPFDELAGDYEVLPRMLLSESCGCVPEKEINIAGYISDLCNRFSRFQNEDRVLNEIAARIQVCDNILTASMELKNAYMYDMCVLLKSECLDERVDPGTIQTRDSFGDDFLVILNTQEAESKKPERFFRKNIVPNLDFVLASSMPVVFTAIHAMQIPLGYACFFYQNHDEQNYYKIFQITNTLNSAFSGYRNLHYQRYLQKQIEDSYKLDTLTGYYNRNGFFREYEMLLDQLKKNGGSLVIALADLDNLKYINDTFGHAIGDKAICAVANALRRACPGAICCRFGGDEMLAVQAKTADGDNDMIRERLNSYMNEYNRMRNTPFPFSASLGVYETDDLSQMSFETLLVKADELMYEEKKKKKIRRGEAPV